MEPQPSRRMLGGTALGVLAAGRGGGGGECGTSLGSPQELGSSFGVPLGAAGCGELTATRLGAGLRYRGGRVREAGGQRRPDAPLRQGWGRPEGPGVLLR